MIERVALIRDKWHSLRTEYVIPPGITYSVRRECHLSRIRATRSIMAGTSVWNIFGSRLFAEPRRICDTDRHSPRDKEWGRIWPASRILLAFLSLCLPTSIAARLAASTGRRTSGAG